MSGVIHECAGCMVEAELAAWRAANERSLLFATAASKPIKPDSLVRPMNESEARYLGLLYLEAQGWI